MDIEPVIFSLCTLSLYDLIHVRGFNYDQYTNNSKITTFNPDLSSELQINVCNCLPTSLPYRRLKLNRSTTDLWSFPDLPHPPLVFPITIDSIIHPGISTRIWQACLTLLSSSVPISNYSKSYYCYILKIKYTSLHLHHYYLYSRHYHHLSEILPLVEGFLHKLNTFAPI